MGVRDSIFVIILSLAIFFIILVKLFFKDDFITQMVYFLSLVMIFIGMLYYLSKTLINENKKILFLILVAAVFIKIALMIVMHQIIIMPDEITGYDELSWRQTKTWRGEYTPQMDDNPCIGGSINANKCIAGSSTYYYYLIAIIYYMFGHSIIIAKLFNIFFSILGGLLIYLIAREIFKNDRISMISLVLVLFFPPITFWTLPLLREALILFLAAASFFLFIKLIKTLKFRYFVFLLFCLGILWNLRSYIVIILVCALVLSGIFMIFAKIKLPKFFIFAMILSVILLAAGFLVDDDSKYWLDSKFRRLDYQRFSSEHGNFAFLAGADISTFKNALLFLPKGLAYFFFSPFIWQMPGITKLIILPNTIASYSILPFIAWGLAAAYKNRKIRNSLSLLAFCILVILLYSLMDGNVWLLDRHKIQASYFLLIFGAVGLNQFFSMFSDWIKNCRVSLH